MADDELDERLDHLPFTLREASRAVDDLLAHLLRSEGHDRLPLNALHALVVAQDKRPIVSVAARLRVSPQAASRLVRTVVTGTVGEDRLVALADQLAELALLDP
ncbi:hypothetical protein BJ986_000696 [Phycicoccus badiiscoriae]|uniref:Uncharacterized protein n=1 Tax=Pedococcus badiiscoriae TaxID=642776 RepID=A0A852WBM9_9MICO|nr:hypothetical protein [Pedococcus badiiscoriae]NYG06209.1 hypothetical protein [Pedococcus badiiscoriae]